MQKLCQSGFIWKVTSSDYEQSPFSPPRLVFLAWGDFHARSRFAHFTIHEEKWALLVVYNIIEFRPQMQKLVWQIISP